jgi:hypothetical protein
MIIKRTKLFSENKKLSENTKNNISTITGAGLGAGAGYGLVKLLKPENLEKLADKIEFKKIAGDKAKGYTSYLENRGGNYEKVANLVKSDKVRKFLKSKGGKAAIIGTVSLGTALGIRRAVKKKDNKSNKKD